METPLPPPSTPAVQPPRGESEQDYWTPEELRADRERRLAWRAGAVLILLNAVMNVTTLAFGLTANVGAVVVSTIVDLAVAVNLFRDQKSARDLAVVRLVLGLVVYGIINGVSEGIAGAAATVLIVGAILLVLVGQPLRWRTVVGSVGFLFAFVVFLGAMAITGFASRATGLSAGSMEQLRQAQKSMQAEDYPAAILQYGELTRAEPDSAVAFFGLCNAYQESGNGSLAINACDKASELAPKDGDVHSYRGLVLLNMRRYEEAEAAADTALGINEKDYFGYFVRGVSRYMLGKEGYQDDFARGVELAPNEEERAAFEETITQITGD